MATSEPQADEAPSQAERLLLPFVQEPMLRPLLIVAILCVVAFMTPALVLAVRDRTLGAQAAILAVVLLAGSGIRAELRKRGRPGALTAIIAVIAALTAGAAVAAHRAGIF